MSSNIFKKQIILSLALASGLCSLSEAANDFIIQTDLNSGLTQHIYVQGPDSVGEKSGFVFASMPVGVDGSRFQMFGVGLAPDSKLYLLADTTTGSYLPTAKVETSSVDGYAAVTRTRADEPFNAKLTFGNLSTEVDAPEASKSVYVERLVVEYAEGNDRVSIHGDQDLRLVEAYYVNKAGSLEASLRTSLRSDLAFKQKGEEVIRIYALPDQDLGWTIIDEKRVQVWPIADGSISAINSNGVSFDLDGKVLQEVPSLEMNVSDLYPTSQTYLQIYKGERADSAEGIQQLSGVISARDYLPVAFNTTVPQSASQVISTEQWQEFAQEDGVYTVEIVTRTPFDEGRPERLAYATFTLKRSIKINGSLVDAEK